MNATQRVGTLQLPEGPRLKERVIWMRKIQTLGHGMLVVALAAAVAAPLTLTACGGGASEPQADAETAPEEQAQEAEPEEAPQSKYAVTIDGSTVTTDYEGNPAMIIDFSFTNNSDEATSFAVACSQKAFQNGVQLETAIVMDDLGNGYMAEIKPGATTQARLAFSLADESDVTVEVSELFSLYDTILAEATFSVA